jgi:hypothetical protein
MRRHLTWLACAFVSASALLIPPSLAQSGGGFDLSHNTIDGGGATFSSAGAFALGGTIGQPDAGPLQSGATYELRGGFWPGVLVRGGATPTPTATGSITVSTPTPSATSSLTATRTNTGVVPPTPTATGQATNTVSPTVATPTASATASPTPTGPTATPTSTPSGEIDTATPTPTETPLDVCVGDCNGNGVVTVDELIIGVNISLGTQPIDRCPAFDPNHTGTVTIEELIQGVNNLLNGCPPG